jgi:hypothetical protein
MIKAFLSVLFFTNFIELIDYQIVLALEFTGSDREACFSESVHGHSITPDPVC